MELSILKVEYRPLFLNKYEYRATFRILGAKFLHHVSSIEEYQKKIDGITSFWDRHKFPLSLYAGQLQQAASAWGTAKDYIGEIDYKTIEVYLEWKKAYKHLFCYRQESDRISIFGNDFEKLETIKKVDPKVKITYAKVLEPNTLYFKKEPKFKFRVHIKSGRYTADFYDTMKQFIGTNKDSPNYGISPALIRSFKDSITHGIMHGSYHIDYNEPSTETYLQILFLGMLGKTYNCKKHPNN